MELTLSRNVKDVTMRYCMPPKNSVGTEYGILFDMKVPTKSMFEDCVPSHSP
jgi:hypothetical protein